MAWVLQLDQSDVKAVGARELGKVVSRVVARLKKECEKCYREDGGTKNRNLQIYAAGDQVIVRKLDDKDKGGHLFSPRGQAACRGQARETTNEKMKPIRKKECRPESSVAIADIRPRY